MFLWIQVDLLEDYTVAAVVAKIPIHAALAEANFYWNKILLPPAAWSIL